MAVTVVVGSQWGDEGKGKIVDLLATQFNVVARYQGGANAGHTIKWGDKTQVLHLLPSGVFSPGVDCVIGNGVVIDPRALVSEIREVQSLGYELAGRLWVSGNAHCILPYHKALEEIHSSEKIGTTKRGIGPAYTDKVARSGIRIMELVSPDLFSKRIKEELERANAILRAYHRQTLNPEDIISEYSDYGRVLTKYVADTADFLHDAIDSGKQILAEGAQGCLLDIDFGTYPYVTSSSPTAGGACTGLGVPPTSINRVIGITKAYCTRVGHGPFPTELNDGTGAHLRKIGGEFGATTGRPRRCGWLDLMALRYSCRLNGFTELTVTKLDVLSGLDTIKVCTQYEHNGETVPRFINDALSLSKVIPRYEVLQGWKENILGCTDVNELPSAAKNLIDHIQVHTGVPVKIISTGPKRSQTIQLGS
ncbi:MAG: adenylosuccinate synthase [Bacteroidetes bacterium]|nr:adenylosuccinate synthase [Bacteroidota bacterium]